MGEAYIGVDVGTGSARAGVFDREGGLLASARRPIAIWREPGEVVEHASADIWRAVCAAVGEAVAASGVPPQDFAGLGFDATCSLVALDRDARPLSVSPGGASERDVIVWMDHRAAEEAERITAAGGAALRYVGGRMSPELQAPKLAWLARHRPETFAAAGHFFDLCDFLAFRATGSLARSVSAVNAKLGYLADEARWSVEDFEAMGLGALARESFARIGPSLVAPGTALARGLTAEAAAVLGLREGLPVGASLIDAHAGAASSLGARGAAGEAGDPRRRFALILGTSACCMATSDAPLFLDGVWGPYYSALTPGLWLAEAGQSAFGAAIDQLLRLHSAFAARSAKDGAAALERLERDIVARAGGLSEAARLAESLHVLPDFLGRRSPDADPASRGAIVGLDLGSDDASLQALYVAGLCGLAYGLADIVARLESGGYACETIVVSGGAAKSALVRQIVADVCGKPLAAPRTPEPVLLGAAMLGVAASGRMNLAEAMGAMSRLAPPILPAGGAIAALHAKKREAQRRLQRAEREIRAAMRAGGAWPALVIFDCDGVLVDSEGLALGAARRAVRQVGFELSEAETRERFLGVSMKSAVKGIEAAVGARLPAGFSASLARDIHDAFSRDLKGIEGVREAVAGLDAKVCVASSSAPERLRHSLRLAGYEALFAPNIFSAVEVAQGKPAPDLYLLAARRMGVDPAECLVVEDSEAGVTGARAAGMAAFGFVGGSHFRGADDGARLTRAGAALIFGDMASLPALIAERRRALRRGR